MLSKKANLPREQIHQAASALVLTTLARSGIRWKPPLPENLERLRRHIQANLLGDLRNPTLAKTAGISVPLSERLDLDLAYRFTDLGSVTTGPGQAQVVRPAGTFSIPIDGTSAALHTQGVVLSLRYAF